MRLFPWVLAVSLAGPAQALDLALSGATPTISDTSIAGSVRLPNAPWDGVTPPPQVEGNITRTVLRSPGGTRTTLQLLAPLRDQLSAAGFAPVFDCADRACGGFDFRFQLDLLGAPEMFVDLGDYRYVLMQRDTGEPHTVSIVTSRSSGAGFIHITEVSAPTLSTQVPEVSIDPTTLPNTGTIAALLGRGHVALSDLEFESGSATLGTGPFSSLSALAEWLSTNPNARIALVGHTDNVGSREGNIALSQQRAEAVRQKLIEMANVNPTRIEAAGVGYLSPLAPNTSAEGRAQNRRVEAVLLSSE